MPAMFIVSRIERRRTALMPGRESKIVMGVVVIVGHGPLIP
jgi:hypothetical protein